MANSIEAMLRGLSGGKTGGLGRVNYMKPVGGLSGGGIRANAGAAPQVRAPGSSDLMVNPNSALSHGDALLKGYWEEWMPTPQQKQARTNNEAFVSALVGNEGQPGLVAGNITPETLQAAMGRAKEGGANAQGMIDILNYAVPAMQQEKEMAWKEKQAELLEKYRQAQIENMNARTDNTRAAGARAAAKGAGGRGGSDPDLAFLKP